MTERPEAVHVYRNERGEVLYEILRFAGKEFRMRRPNAEGSYTWNLNGVERVPYRLEEIFLAEQVFLVEGEKDVDV